MMPLLRHCSKFPGFLEGSWSQIGISNSQCVQPIIAGPESGRGHAEPRFLVTSTGCWGRESKEESRGREGG
ncbi:unnamed protein product [Lampetra planeri]